MTYSFLVIDLNNKININEMLNFYEKNYKNSFEVIYCSCKKVENNKIKNIVFKQSENSEKIINTVAKKCCGENIAVIRNAESYKDVLLLTNKLSNENQIVYFYKKQSKFQHFWYSILKKILSFIFYQNLMPINYGVVLYGQMASTILKKIPAPSVLMKSNGFEGISYTYVFGGTPHKFEYNKTKASLKALLPFILAFIMILIKCLVNFNTIILIDVLYIAIIAIMIVLSVIYTFKWILSSIMGDTIKESAELEE